MGNFARGLTRRWRILLWLYGPLLIYIIFKDSGSAVEDEGEEETVDYKNLARELVVVSDTGEGRSFMVVRDWDNDTLDTGPEQSDLNYIDYWLPPEGDLPDAGPWKGFKLGNQNDSSLPGYVTDLLARVRLVIANRLLDPVNVITNFTYSQVENETVFYNVDMSQERKDAMVGGPMDYDPQFKNPCWISKLNTDQPAKSYSKNPYYIFNIQGYSRINMDSIIRILDKRKSRYRIRCLPYFYIAGVTKSGTTDLFNVLSHHPDIVGPACKEPLYWNRLRYGGQPNVSFTQFVDVFDTLGAQIMKTKEKSSLHKITVDGSPAYIWDFFQWKLLPGNQQLSEPQYILAHTIKAFTPKAKVVVILRNPTSRVFSQFRMWHRNSSLEYFHAACVGSIENLERCLKANSLRNCIYKGAFCYSPDIDVGRVCRFIAASLYYIYVRDWVAVIGRENVILVKAEDYYRQRESSVTEILKFLDIHHMPEPYLRMLQRKKPLNVRNKWRSRTGKGLHVKTKYLLDKFFSPFNKALAKMFDDDKWLWEEER